MEEKQTTDEAQQTTRVDLVATPPLPTLAWAAGLVVGGTALMLIGAAAGWGKVGAIVGLVLLVLGVMLAVVVALLMTRLRSTVLLSADSITVRTAQGGGSLPWREIDSVGLRGRELTLTGRGGQGLAILDPGGPGAVTFRGLAVEIERRLDASRTPGA